MKNKGNIVLIVLLSLLVILLGGYIVYDKVLSKENNNTSSIIVNDNSSQVQNADIVQSTQTYDRIKLDRFDDDFSYIINHYLPILSMQIFDIADKSVFKNDLSKIDMSAFFITYYPIYSNIYCRDYGTMCAKVENDTRYSIEVPRKELDQITYILTGRKDYDNYEEIIREQFGIIKKDNNNYEIAWYPTGYSLFELSETSVIMAGGTQAIVDTTIRYNENGTLIDMGKVRFTFEYDSNNLYHLVKIEKK